MIVHVRVSLLVLSALGLCISGVCVWGQTENAQTSSPQTRIAQDLMSIRTAEQQHMPEAQQGSLWGQLALEYQGLASFAKAEEAYNRSLHLLKTTPSAMAEYASTLDNLSTLYMIYNRVDDAEIASKQALAARQKLGKLSDIGLSQVHLADIALVRHQFKKSGQLAQRGIQGMQSSPDPPKAGLLSAYITLTYARCSRGHCREGVMSAEQAVAFANKTFEPESVASGFALETLGFAEWKSGATQDAEKAMVEGLRILRSKLVSDDPRLAGAMLQYRTYLVEANRPAEAQDIQQQVRSMVRQAGIACSGCAVSVNSLSDSSR
jgi:tetratricopeptide (TPR) repeat protein